jgi:hypothetical protein
MLQAPRVAQAGDICVLLEPDSLETSPLRLLQSQLRSSFGGNLQERVHFTCQRFSLSAGAQLPGVIRALRQHLSGIQPFAVRANRLELVNHPFWEFCVLRWDLHRSDEMLTFARCVDDALLYAGMTPHYPAGEGWRPHVTALEAVVWPTGYHLNGTHKGQLLYTARRVALSQVLPGKHFQILATIEL